MKIISWNVNGIRAALKKGLADYVAASDADIICLQETRALPEQVDVEFHGYEMHWNPAEKKGYSGTAFLTRVDLGNVTRGLGRKKLDTEGRVLTAELEHFFLVNVYTPNAQRGLTRLDFRTREWDPAFRRYLKKLEKTKPVVFCGDLNVAHKEIDLANPKTNRRNAGFTDEERTEFDRLIRAGFVDTFREFNQEPGQYTWWSNFGGARSRNVGWRIDYFGVSKALRPALTDAAIYMDVMGSDHCPVSIDIET